MFKKTMIAMAVLSMAAGAQATYVTQEDIKDYLKDNVVNVDAGEIYQPGADKGAWELKADSITVKNNTPSGEKDGNHAVWANGKLTLETTKGDIVLESSNIGLYASGHTAAESQAAELTVKSAKDIRITTKSGWAVKNEKNSVTAQGYNNGLIMSAKGDIIIKGANGITNNGHGTKLNVSAQNVSIEATSSKAVSGTYGETVIAAEKDLVIKGGAHSAITAIDGTLTLKAGQSTTINGDIKFDRAAWGEPNPTNGTINIVDTGKTVINGNVVAKDGGTMNITLAGAGSQLNGAIKTDKTEQDLTPTTNIGFKDGATWNVEGASHVTNLALAGGVVDLKGQNVTVDAMGDKSTGTIRMDVGADGKKEVGSFTVTTPNNAKLTADLVQNADVVTAEIAKKALANIKTEAEGNKGLTVTADVKEGLVNPGTIYGEGGKVLSTTGNSLMRDTLQLAQTSSLSLNRILMNDVRKRMGDLRAAEGKHGAWARYDGGRLSGEGGFENDFHTIQVGVDTMPLDNGVRFGLAGSYTKGDAEYARGDADMDAFGLAAYATWMGDNGMFVDGVARMAKASNDLTVDRDMKGKLDSLAVSLSGEFGWRFPIAANAYVEPQFEATYTYIDGEKMTLSNGKQEANYELGSFDSFLTRAGVLAGYTFPNNKGDVYVRASAVHEFLGDSEISGKTGKTGSHMERIDGKDTWVEFGLGGNYSVTPNTYVWADVERTTGASIETDYRATVGVRYAF